MQLDRDDIVASFKRKGFKKDDRDHEYYIYWNKLGEKTIRKTKVSRGTSYRTIQSNLIGQMSRQVGLSKEQFKTFVECAMSRDQYEEAVFPRP